MEIIAILRVLWRRRVLVALGLVASIAIGVLVGRSDPTTSGVAWTRMALDTEPSQVVAPTPEGADTLGWRAILIGDLMLSEPLKQKVADASRVPVDELAIVEPVLDVPSVPAALPRRVAEVAVPAAPYLLTVTSSESLATISLHAAGPDRAAAVRLAEAAADVLSGEGNPAGTDAQPYVIRRSAAMQSLDVTSGGGGRRMAAMAVFVLFLLWCGALVVVPRRRRRPSGPRVRPEHRGARPARAAHR